MGKSTSGGSWAAQAVSGGYAATDALNAPETKDYAIDGILPRTGAAIFFGPGSTGKTQFLLWLAAHLAARGPEAPETWMDATIRRRGQILVLSAEDLREDIFLRIKGIVRQMDREGAAVDMQDVCSRLHVIPFLSLGKDEFTEPNPSLFHRENDGQWKGTPTLDQIEQFIQAWNDAADADQDPERRIIGVIMDSAVSMAGFELSNSEATINLLFRINRTSQRQGVFWAIIGHTPKDTQKNDDPASNAVGRLRGSAMWSTTPRTVVELRIAGEHENLAEVQREFPGIGRRDIVIATVVKANSKGADFRPRVLRRLTEGAFEDITGAFPSVCEGYADRDERIAMITEAELAAVVDLIRGLTDGKSGARFSREEVLKEFEARRTDDPVLKGMLPDVASKDATRRHSLAAALKILGERGILHVTRSKGASFVVVNLDPPTSLAA